MKKHSTASLLLALGVVFTTCITGASTNASSNRDSVRASPLQADARRAFPETGQVVEGAFLNYWQANGGLAQFGYPISGNITERSSVDGNDYSVQYFERAVFELHPEHRGTPYEVLLSLLGTLDYEQHYPNGNGAPGQKPSSDHPLKFEQTGKTVGGVFRTYWETHGGLARQGYPITEEFQERSPLNGKTYTIQYFERSVFEFHPENAGTPYEVLLSQLGKFRYDAKSGGWSIFPRTATIGCWTKYTNPLADTTQGQLAAIDAVSDNDAWAVGHVGVDYYNAYHMATLTMHWNGVQWRRMPSPNKAQPDPNGPDINRLIAVSATSASDAWALSPAMLLHWDGKTWSEVAHPEDGYLTGVAALSPTDVWVVGSPGSPQQSDFLILHWDGKNWTRIKDVNFAGAIGRDTATKGTLTAIKAFSANDVWAVGSGSTPGSQVRPIALHWDGAQWSAKLFDAGDNFVQLNALGGTGSQDLWAVGERRGTDGQGWRYGPYVFTAHWDGRAWSTVDSPDPIYWKDRGGTLYGVSATGKDDVWAAGSVTPEGSPFSFLSHWDGQRWSVVKASLGVGDHASTLMGVAGAHGGLWAVGSEDHHQGSYQAYIVYHAPNCLDPTPVPSPTQRPPLPPTETPNPAP